MTSQHPGRTGSRLLPLIGAPTGLLIGTGVAIGSGIFRNPSLVAKQLHSPAWIIAAWIFAGLFFTLAGLMLAELATRYPRAGGEYVYLREAYGDFAAFLFGWASPIFVTGAGCAVMAAAVGDFACELMHWPVDRSRLVGTAVLGAIVALNLGGLRIGAVTQNVFSLLKIAALLAVVGYGALAGRPIDWLHADAAASAGSAASAPVAAAGLFGWLHLFAAAMMPVMWCYEGTTDSAKMSEEIRDPRRALPIALVGAGLLVTIVYVLFNWALLRILSPSQMAATVTAPADVLTRWFGPRGADAMLLVALATVLGGLSSTIIAGVRVPFALARDGMSFAVLARMSRGQSPTAALLLIGALAAAFTLSGTYYDVLLIYTISTGFIFGLVNLSLFTIRRRERAAARTGAPPPSGDYFRCPAGEAVSLFLAAVQFVIGAGNAWLDMRDGGGIRTMQTAALLGAIALMYLAWRGARVKPAGQDGLSGKDARIGQDAQIG